jgi:hypothetical protein
VRFAGLIHPGLIGTAPSKELLDIWNERERSLVEAGPEGTALGGVLHTRPLACLPGARCTCPSCFSGPGSFPYQPLPAPDCCPADGQAKNECALVSTNLQTGTLPGLWPRGQQWKACI